MCMLVGTWSKLKPHPSGWQHKMLKIQQLRNHNIIILLRNLDLTTRSNS